MAARSHSACPFERRAGPTAGTPQAQRGIQALRDKYGPEHFAQIGKKGGESTRERHGVEHFRRIAQLGALKRRLPGEDAFHLSQHPTRQRPSSEP